MELSTKPFKLFILSVCFAGAAFCAANLQLPVAFVPNLGQTNSAVRFVGTGPQFRALFFHQKVLLRQGRVQMKVQFRNAAPGAVLVASKPIGAIANFLHGNQPAAWQTGIPMQGEISYRGLWPGIDLRYQGVNSRMKAEYLVAPNGDPANIRVSYEGRVAIENDGSLLVHGSEGEYREDRPILYQTIGSQRREIPGGFRMLDNSTVGFWTGAYDHSRELVIDPYITYSTLFGGSSQDNITGVGYDSLLNTYTTGYTSSSDLPIVNPAKSRGGGTDAFVAKYSVGTGKLLYCTFLGGGGDDRAFGITVNPSGEAYVTGWTSSTNFPVLNAAQLHLSGSRNAFVTKLNAAGTGLVYSTYFGGNGVTSGNAIAVDPAGEIAIAGDTTSTNLPATGTFQNLNKGGQDAFILKLKPTGAIQTVAYFGGGNIDHASSIAMDSYGAIAIGGSTYSTDLPMVSAYENINPGGQVGFVASMPGSAATLFFSTYFGGSSGSANHPEAVNGIAIDTSGSTASTASIYIAGITSSSDFPITSGAYQTTFGGGSDGYVAHLASNGGLIASTLYGGTLLDGVNAIALDFYGNPHIAGFTNSIDFPISRPVQSLNRGSRDAFLAKLDKALAKVIYSSYLGGLGTDSANALVVDSMATVTVVGQTASTDFPTFRAAQTAKTAALTGFMTKVIPNWTAAMFYYGLWFLDTTHSRGSDGTSFTGTVLSFGQSGDIPIAGDWDGTGHKKIGIFRNGTWILDSNANGQVDASDRTFVFGQAGDYPVVGDWDGTGKVRAGLFRNGTFILDYSGHLSGVATGKTDVTFAFGQTGDTPVAGDWNSSGTAKIGIFRAGTWIVDHAGDRSANRTYTFGTTNDFPLVGDWDGSGKSKIGVFRNPAWALDYDGDNALTAPGFNELIFWYGITGIVPVVL